jgi:hypothetical protein
MSELFGRHHALLDGALLGGGARGAWAPFPEITSGKVRGGTAPAGGPAAAAPAPSSRRR